MKCHVNLLNGSRALIHKGIRTDGRDEANRLFARLKWLVLFHLPLLLLLLVVVVVCVYNFSALDRTLYCKVCWISVVRKFWRCVSGNSSVRCDVWPWLNTGH